MFVFKSRGAIRFTLMRDTNKAKAKPGCLLSVLISNDIAKCGCQESEKLEQTVGLNFLHRWWGPVFRVGEQSVHMVQDEH